MKKVLALVLSLAMTAGLATTAMAASAGDSVKVAASAFKVSQGVFGKTGEQTISGAGSNLTEAAFKKADGTNLGVIAVADTEINGVDANAKGVNVGIAIDGFNGVKVTLPTKAQLDDVFPKPTGATTVDEKEAYDEYMNGDDLRVTATLELQGDAGANAAATLDITMANPNKKTSSDKPGLGEMEPTVDFGNSYGEGGRMFPGNTYGYNIPDDILPLVNSKTTISVSWSVGGAMVDSVTLKDKDKSTAHVAVKLNENFTFAENNKRLEGTITFKKLSDGSSKKVKFVNMEVNNDYDTSWTGYSNKDDAEDDIHTVLNNTVYEIDGSGWVCFGDEGRLIQVLAKFSDEQKIFAYFNENKIDAVLDKYDDGEADIDFIRFVAKPELKKTSTITFDRGFSTKGYIYEWANGKLNNIKGAKWDSEDGTWTIETNKLGDYVFSDEKLISETSEASSEEESSSDTGSTTEPNPGTGASDFVGLAVALAVVSVAGIAVAKRK